MSWGRKSREGNTGGEGDIGLDDVVGNSGVECGRFTDALRTNSCSWLGWMNVLGGTSSLTGLVATLEYIPSPVAGSSTPLASVPSPFADISAVLGADSFFLTGFSDDLETETDSSCLTGLGDSLGITPSTLTFASVLSCTSSLLTGFVDVLSATLSPLIDLNDGLGRGASPSLELGVILGTIVAALPGCTGFGRVDSPRLRSLTVNCDESFGSDLGG